MNASTSLVVSLHDVAPPFWPQAQRILSALARAGVPRRSLLVIPNYQGRGELHEHDAFCDWLRERQAEGDELVLHGYEHVGVGTPASLRDRWKNRWYTQGEGEFLSLDYDDATHRIRRGLEAAARARLHMEGFVAPAWLIGDAGLRAARNAGLQYTNSYLHFTDLALGRRRWAPSLVFGPGHLNEDVGLRVQSWLVGLLSRMPVARIVLHPPCVDHDGRFARILEIVAALARTHEPITYRDLLVAWRGERSQGREGVHAQ